MITKTNIWKEIRTDYTDDNGVTTVDAWVTGSDDEEGKVIAYIVNGEVYPVDHRIYTDQGAMEAIREFCGNSEA